MSEMKLAIADPPYLGRGKRWYGGGRGSSPRWPAADNHPDAALWDDPQTHVNLVSQLVSNYDGWVIAASADSLPLYLNACPTDTRVMIWWRRNAFPSNWRVTNSWEPVLTFIPKERRARGIAGTGIRDVLDAPVLSRGFVGSKPPAWTQWVLDALGYSEGDHLTDLFPGSGAVTQAANMLALPGGY